MLLAALGRNLLLNCSQRSYEHCCNSNASKGQACVKRVRGRRFGGGRAQSRELSRCEQIVGNVETWDDRKRKQRKKYAQFAVAVCTYANTQSCTEGKSGGVVNASSKSDFQLKRDGTISCDGQ